MITQDFQSPSGGSWCGIAQNSNIHGSARSALSLSPSRKSSTCSGVAEASQAAPDLIPRGLKVELSGSDKPDNMFAEFFNATPFLLDKLKGPPQFLDLRPDRPNLTQLASLGLLDQSGDFLGGLSQQTFREIRQIDGLAISDREPVHHAVRSTPRSARSQKQNGHRVTPGPFHPIHPSCHK